MSRFVARLAAVLALGALPVLALAQSQPAPQPAAKAEIATFAGGCFWCMEPPFDKTEGVLETTSGFMGGRTSRPTYAQVVTGGTGHAEVVQVKYDPAKVSYEKLLEVFWMNIDPIDSGGQFCDRGDMYRTAVFFHDEKQKAAALASKKAIDDSRKLPKPIVTEITAAGEFTRAEEYHQDFYKKNPGHYTRYRFGCGRDRRLEQLWGKAPTN